MKNWKTTLGGLLTAIGALIVLSQNPYLHAAGQVLTIAGPLLMGAAAKDISGSNPKI